MRVMLPTVKAHIVVAMVAFLVTSLAMEDVTHEGVIHHSPTMELLNTAIMKRQLRSSADMTSVDASNRGERRLAFNIERISIAAEEGWEKLVADTKTWWLRWQTKGDSDTLFKYLKLEVNDDLFWNPGSATWRNYLIDNYGEKEAYDMMFQTMLRQSDDITAAKLIFVEPSYPIPYLEKPLLHHWLERGETPKTLLDRLFPGKDVRSLLDNSLFMDWKSYAGLNLEMLVSLTTKFGAVDLVTTVVKHHYLDATKLGKAKSSLGLCYGKFLYLLEIAGISEKLVGKLLELESADTSFRTTLLASSWLDYVFLRTLDTSKSDKYHRMAVRRRLAKYPSVKKLLEKEDIGGPLLIWKYMLQTKKVNERAWSAKFWELR